MDASTKRTAKRVLKTTSDDDRKQIISAYENGFKPSVIGHMLNIKTATVYGIIKKYKETWQIEAKKRGGNNAKLLSKEAVDSIRGWVKEDSTITLRALADKVYVKYGVRAGISTIGKEVKELYRSPRTPEAAPDTGQKLWQICRFCLNRDEEKHVPVKNILDSYLTIENIERFTGVSIRTNDHTLYAVCPDCTNILQNSVLFRFSCIRNDAYLRAQFPLDETSPAANNVNACDDQDPLGADNDYTVFEIYEPLATIPYTDSQATLNTKNMTKLVNVKEEFNATDCIETETIPNSDSQPRLNATNTLELLDVQEELNFANSIESSTIHNTKNQTTLTPTNKFQQVNVAEEYYSANYNDPCEPTCSDDEEYKSDDTNNASCSSNMGTVRYSNKKTRIYKKNGTNVSVRQQKVLCNTCGKFVNSLEKHMVIHTQEARYACPHCPIKMMHKVNLTRHIKAIHLKIDIKSCKLCGKGFISKNSFLSHMRSHHGSGKMYNSKICFKKYVHPSGLGDHYNSTHSLDCHKRAICSMSLTTRESLRIHNAVPSSDKSYACSECPKRFKNHNAKMKHQLTHSGVVFECTICDKLYYNKLLLNKHIKKMHTNNEEGGK